MQFRLLYEGRLPSNGSVAQKHAIRQALHPQLKELWEHEPLVTFAERWLKAEPEEEGDLALLRSVGDFEFAPLVSTELALLTEIEIVLLKASSPGALIRQGGDIDNQLKTLFDALRCPTALQEIPAGTTPTADEQPFFCLLDDDEKIVNLSVAVDRYLDPPEANAVHVSLFVKTRPSKGTWGNLPLS
jgi:hypothetical protein